MRVGTWEAGPRFAETFPTALAFSPDSRLLAIEAGFGAIRLVDPEAGSEVARFESPLPSRLEPLCFTPDGGRLIVHAHQQRAVYVWDLRLIREQLADIGLDWDTKPLPPAAAKRPPLASRSTLPSGCPSRPRRRCSPLPGAVLDNGSPDSEKVHAWEFAWSEVKGAMWYHLHVVGPSAGTPAVNDSTLSGTTAAVRRSGPVTESDRRGWRWKVRAIMPDGWTAWSEVRTFDVAPVKSPDKGTPPLKEK